MENIEAKTVKLCDNCKSPMNAKDKDTDKADYIEATLTDGKDKTKTKKFDFDSEECLRQFLNGRAKKKQSKASLDLFEFKIK